MVCGGCGGFGDKMILTMSGRFFLGLVRPGGVEGDPRRTRPMALFSERDIRRRVPGLYLGEKTGHDLPFR